MGKKNKIHARYVKVEKVIPGDRVVIDKRVYEVHCIQEDSWNGVRKLFFKGWADFTLEKGNNDSINVVMENRR